MQSLSQSMPIEISGCFNFGNTCAFRAALGRFSCGSRAICVEVIIDPSGNVMGMGFLAVCLFTHGVLCVIKCAVVPESATACGGTIFGEKSTVTRFKKL